MEYYTALRKSGLRESQVIQTLAVCVANSVESVAFI